MGVLRVHSKLARAAGPLPLLHVSKLISSLCVLEKISGHAELSGGVTGTTCVVYFIESQRQDSENSGPVKVWRDQSSNHRV